MEKQSYLKYKSGFFRIKLCALIKNCLAVVLLLSLLVLPIFTCGYTIKGEKVTKKVSFLKEFLSNFKTFDKKEDFSSFIGYFFLAGSIVVIIYGCLSLGIYVKRLISSISEVNNPEQTAMLEYSKAKKSGEVNGEKKKKSFFERTSVFRFLSLLIGILILYRLLGKLSAGMNDIGADELIEYMYSISPLSTLKGINALIILFAILFIGYCVVDILQKKKEKEVLVQITQEELDGEQQHTDNVA